MSVPKRADRGCPSTFGSTMRFYGSLKGAKGTMTVPQAPSFPLTKPFCGACARARTSVMMVPELSYSVTPSAPFGTPIAVCEKVQQRMTLSKSA